MLTRIQKIGVRQCRKVLFLLLLCLVAVATAAPRASAEEADPALPLSRVVLFSSGVGFFEHQGQVEGDTQVELQFRVEDVNDLLKSMVLQDLGGGRIATVTYGSKEPITKTLKTFAIDLTENPTMAALLAQIRGELVQIDAPNKIEGLILSVERRRQRVGKDEVIEVDVLNLLTDEGLRSVPLDSVGRIKLVDEKLDAELRQALAVLAGAHATDKKTVTLNFLGEGRRTVRVGYVQETPIWKTSYRLVLGENDPPLLQGWAIVENTGEMDWNDVQLTLVSGRPISFEMDLYESLYVQRPHVEPELFASLRPPTYDQNLAEKQVQFEALRIQQRQLAPGESEEGVIVRRDKLGSLERSRQAGGGGFGRRGSSLRAELAAPGTMSADLDIQQGVQSVASAAEVGELFQYVIDQPVTLPRRMSAMLPIVNASVEGKKVSIYNPQVHAKHPLVGLRLKNSTELHLMQGPITVFDEGTYAGDAQIADLPPGGERLISYAMDLDTEVAREQKSRPEMLTSVRITKGIMHTEHKYRRSVQYTIKNSGTKAKTVLIEQPYSADWKLTAPEEPDEKTRDRYRFAVQAEPGKPAELKVEEERIVHQQLALNNLDDRVIGIYLAGEAVSEKVKGALGELVHRKRELEEVARARQQRDAEIKTIGTEQERIRRNMQSLNRNSDIYNRYVKKFGDQEDQVERLRAQIKELNEKHDTRRVALDEFLLALELE